jgi:hypothetical protein
VHIHYVEIKTELRSLLVDIWALQRTASDFRNFSNLFGHLAALAMVLLIMYSGL